MKLLFLSIFFLSCQGILAQQNKIDSLLSVVDSYPKEDSLTVVYFLELAKQYSRTGDVPKAEAYGAKALAIAKNLPQTKSLYAVYYRMAHIYHGHELFSAALDNYNKALTLEKARGDKRKMAGLYVDMSAVYAAVTDYPKALESNQLAIGLFNEVKDTESIGSNYMNVGSIYLDMKMPLEAYQYTQKALAVFSSGATSPYGLSIAYDVIGNVIQMASDTQLQAMGIRPANREQEALRNYMEGLRLARIDSAKGNDMLGQLYKDIGLIYQKTGNDAKAMQYFNLALNFAKGIKFNVQIADVAYTIGNYYAHKQQYSAAKKYFFESLTLAKTTGLPLVRQNTLNALSKIYEQTGKPDSALWFYRQSVEIKDSLFSKEKDREITRRQLQLDFAVKEHDYQLQQQESNGQLKAQQAQISSDKKIKLFLGIAIALAIIIAGLIFNNQRRTKNLNTIINRQKTALEQLGHVKDTIFSVVSHDMRAPVNSLLSFIDILDHGKISAEKMTVYAKDLKQELSYTSSLMNNLLSWAASQMQGFKPVMEDVDAFSLVNEVFDTLQVQVKDKQVLCRNDVPAGVNIHSDRNMIALVLRNLVGNAIKYSYKEGLIVIAAEQETSGCKLTVRDQGTGMDAAAIAAFNSPEKQQAESKRGTANEKGTGLGLLLCKTFTEQMGGTIVAMNTGEGMVFSIWLFKGK